MIELGTIILKEIDFWKECYLCISFLEVDDFFDIH